MLLYLYSIVRIMVQKHWIGSLTENAEVDFRMVFICDVATVNASIFIGGIKDGSSLCLAHLSLCCQAPAVLNFTDTWALNEKQSDTFVL